LYPALAYLGVIRGELVGKLAPGLSLSPSIIMIGFIINCIAVLFFISAGLLLVHLIRLVQRQKTRPRPRKRIRQTSLTSAANPQLQSRLLQLLNGDRRAAARLIRHARQQNPGRSESWCLEKAIFDLERDRH